MTAALPLFGAFLLGLGSRRWLQRHVSFLVRAQLAGGIGLLAVLSGWSFHVSVGSVSAILILLVAQLTAVAAGSWLFRRSGDGPLVAFGMYGNPTFWSLPVATATLGAKAAVFLVAYDMLTQPRIALAIRFLRLRAPIAQQSRTALADYAPTIGAISGLILGHFVPAPDVIATVVAVLGIAMAIVGALLLGVAWPTKFLGRAQTGLGSARPRAALHSRPGAPRRRHPRRHRPARSGLDPRPRPDPDVRRRLRPGLRLLGPDRGERPRVQHRGGARRLAPLALMLAH